MFRAAAFGFAMAAALFAGWPEDREAARLLWQKGKYVEAEQLFRSILAVREAELGPAAAELAPHLSDLGGLLLVQNQVGPASEQYTRALSLLEANRGPQHMDLLPVLGALVRVRQLEQRVNDVREILLRTLAIRIKNQGPEHVDVGWEMYRLARYYASRKDWNLAEVHYRSALAILAKNLGWEDPRLAAVYDNFAAVFRELELWVDMEDSLDSLAAVLVRLKRFEEAQPLYERALFIWSNTLGPNHALLATSLDNLAFVYASQQMYARALPHYLRSLEIRERLHSDSLQNAGLIDSAMENNVSAEARFREALRIVDQPGPPRLQGPEPAGAATHNLDDDRPARLAVILENFSEILRRMGRDEEAQKLEMRLKELVKNDQSK
ncbi:MAG: tetratricopeptide repeat protein [Bryobacter sp.]|nr:tetratricopeptide repeat protein [Bryobacter sp.]